MGVLVNLEPKSRPMRVFAVCWSNDAHELSGQYTIDARSARAAVREARRRLRQFNPCLPFDVATVDITDSLDDATRRRREARRS